MQQILKHPVLLKYQRSAWDFQTTFKDTLKKALQNICECGILKKILFLSKSITLDNQTYTAPATGQVKPGQVFQNSAERTRSPHLYIEQTIIYALYHNTGSDKNRLVLIFCFF